MHLMALGAVLHSEDPKAVLGGNGSKCTVWRLVLSHVTLHTCPTASTPHLNAPYGARCFLTWAKKDEILADNSHNAPDGARCFLTARRGVLPVTRGNAMSDRQWSKKHPSNRQAQG